VTETSRGRMLLSHNFDIADGSLPAFSRAEFTALFAEGFPAAAQVTCREVDNPHWVVEVLFPSDRLTPAQVGDQIAQILAAKRRSQVGDRPLPAILILGGSKTTPATSPSPDALQIGQWGVDVVETPSAEKFLQGIGWAETVATRASESVFKVELESDKSGN
jgi:Protein of unknown function (DUF2656)